MKKKAMKKLGGFLLAAILLFTTSACGGGNQSAAPQAQAESPKASGDSVESAEKPDKVYTIKLGYVQGDKDPVTIGLYKYKEIVEAGTNGGVQVEVYHSNQLGDTPDLLEQIKTGSNVGCISDASRFSGSVPELAILNAPYIYESYEDGKKVISSDIAQKMYDDLNKKEGYKILTFNWWQGSRNFITNKEVTKVADLSGLRIRSPGTPLYNKMIEALGAKPTGLPWNDIYNAMETKVVDGAEGQTPGIYAARLQEVAEYMSRTGHIQLFTALIVGDQWFNALPQEYQKVMLEASQEAGDYASEIARNETANMEKEMEAAGMKITDVDTAEFKSAIDKMYKDFPEFTEVKKEIDEFLKNG
ncbi:C4-dicarboxylate ABC transporter [Anaerotruncus sp. AF02-27]|uniref:C4-dicarboxylate TRAP transporter substrate-binding protein n=1 Tax=Anaerotruncus TaxID=244127 RepID=UPI000E4B5F7B|nr:MULTISPECIES: C4-dicarboxylate TRAP transporter substrate-binding protein [Anaerotruncus]RGX55485.1 C4-dicarboxylate ABC transporter [Anaerotruncus sp. AF02-27]